ncbi:MAG: N-acetylmuramidase [Nitrospinaceae bacterium]|jgi:lysozyme family protein|nr:N-acetylmuramidase [Nitrospinaceae bacterium]MBT3433645.1 N-acetylmuramidase [Nitrospinaceae bacterium]MBT3822880.1 N-acetylmuramidase [Nitrospinaceae bacterium]MBT4095885.1 N-acetylmuramidase [Nitrospinaceae bacterium]MBT4431110.1 N-acetylmuramidase [Nitrospinaceae bacterium]
MADFDPAFKKTILIEGGYKLHETPGDTGGMTYAGVSRRWHPKWPGWKIIDKEGSSGPRLAEHVRDFYRAQFWDRMLGDEIKSQEIAESIYDFAVNAGKNVGFKLAQLTVGASPDGAIGPKTVKLLNVETPEIFDMKFAIAKVARYAAICNGDFSQKKFLLGWLNRTMEVLA